MSLIFVAMVIMVIMAFLLGYLFAKVEKEQPKELETPRPTVLEKVFTKKEKQPESKPPDEENINTFYQ